MPVLRPDTLVQKALQILAVTGEFPWSSLYLLGNPPTVQKMVSRLSQPVLFRNPHTGEEVRTKLFVTNETGRGKSLRLYKGALPLLHWLHPHAYDYYMDSFWNHHFPGDAATVTGTTGWRKPWPSVPMPGWRCSLTICPGSSKRRSARSRQIIPLYTWPGM